MLLDLLTILALLNMAAIFGYAFSASAVSYPAMVASDRAVAVGYFKPFFHKSNHLMLGLSLCVWAISLALSLLSGQWLYFVAATFLQISGPYTIFILMPVNNRIMAEGADIHSDQMTQDRGNWGTLHLPRTLIAGTVFLAFAYATVAGGV